MKYIAVMMLAVALVACGHTPTKPVTKIETVTVYKPVYKVPTQLKELSVVERPTLAIEKLQHLQRKQPLTPEELQQVISSYLATIAQLRKYATKLESNQRVIRAVVDQDADVVIPETTRTVRTVEP